MGCPCGARQGSLHCTAQRLGRTSPAAPFCGASPAVPLGNVLDRFLVTSQREVCAGPKPLLLGKFLLGLVRSPAGSLGMLSGALLGVSLSLSLSRSSSLSQRRNAFRKRKHMHATSNVLDSMGANERVSLLDCLKVVALQTSNCSIKIRTTPCKINLHEHVTPARAPSMLNRSRR